MRYDSSHGQAHRDLLDWSGHNGEERWLSAMTHQEALNFALWDLKTGWRRYWAEFIRREGMT